MDNIIEGFRFLSDNLENVCKLTHNELYEEDIEYINCWSFTNVIERQIILDKLEVFDSKLSDRSDLGSFLHNYEIGRFVMIINYSDATETYVHWFAVIIDEYGYAHLFELRDNEKLYLESTKSVDMFDDIILILEAVKPDKFYNQLIKDSDFTVIVYSRNPFNVVTLSKNLV